MLSHGILCVIAGLRHKARHKFSFVEADLMTASCTQSIHCVSPSASASVKHEAERYCVRLVSPNSLPSAVKVAVKYCCVLKLH